MTSSPPVTHGPVRTTFLNKIPIQVVHRRCRTIDVSHRSATPDFPSTWSALPPIIVERKIEIGGNQSPWPQDPAPAPESEMLLRQADVSVVPAATTSLRSPSQQDSDALMQKRWVTVKEATTLFPYTEGALRHLIFQSEAYQKFPNALARPDGFEKCIVRPPGQRRVLIDTEQFSHWLTTR
jgi:hypothetical protein